jgi:hypothetical protein
VLGKREQGGPRFEALETRPFVLLVYLYVNKTHPKQNLLPTHNWNDSWNHTGFRVSFQLCSVIIEFRAGFP